MKARLIAALVACIVVLSGAAAAQAQEGTTRGPGGIKDTSPQSRPQGISGMLSIPWYRGAGVAVTGRYEIPIVPNGFIPQINDQFSIEPSLGLAYFNQWGSDWNYFTITPAVYAIWSFHITSKFRPYAAIGVGAEIAAAHNDRDSIYGDARAAWVYIDTTVGLFYNFSRNVAFRGELGYGGPKAGIHVYF